jgi:hypothetical protein
MTYPVLVSTRTSARADTDGGAAVRAAAISAAALGMRYASMGAIDGYGAFGGVWPYAPAQHANTIARAVQTITFIGPPRKELVSYNAAS